MSQARRLRQRLDDASIVVTPGAYDAWSARLVERAGFEAVYMTGYGAAASMFALPDLGLMTGSEMLDQARRMADAIDVPLIADADNGFGDVLNVRRTVQQYERAGVAAIQIEDQVLPKKCGHMEGKKLVESDLMVQKIRSAAAARAEKDFVIIARTDARSVIGLDEAFRRGEQYLEAGADVLFIESPYDESELRKISETFGGWLIANMAPGCKTPYLCYRELQEMGYSMVIYPIDTLLTVTSGLISALNELKTSGKISEEDLDVDFKEFNKIMNLESYIKIEEEFSVKNKD